MKRFKKWNGEALDALVVPKDKISELMRELQNAAIAPLRSVDRKTDPQIGYFLVTQTKLIDTLVSRSHPKPLSF